MQDLHSHLALQATLSPAVYTADQNGAAVDRKGFNSITHVIHLGTTGDTLATGTRIDLKLQDSDDGVTWLPVTRELDLLQSSAAPYQAVDANGVFAVVDSAAEDDVVLKVGYIGYRRFSRVVCDFVGTHTNGIEIGMLAIKGHAESLPVAAG